MIKATGMNRKLDELGRIVIPAELRSKFGILEKDSMEIFVNNSCIVLRKVESACVFCGRKEKLRMYKEKAICEKCAQSIAANA